MKISEKEKIADLTGQHTDNLILYHGSRGGLDGPIRPESRIRCDFEPGFYMSSSLQEAKTVVAADMAPVFYELELDLSRITDEKILILDSADWLYTVLAYRGSLPESADSKELESFINRCQYADIVVGPMADGKLNEVVRVYQNGQLTESQVAECMHQLDYGYSIVAKTNAACSYIRVISERDIDGDEVEQILKLKDKERKETQKIIEDIIRNP